MIADSHRGTLKRQTESADEPPAIPLILQLRVA
jgi:hypothetical protein